MLTNDPLGRGEEKALPLSLDRVLAEASEIAGAMRATEIANAVAAEVTIDPVQAEIVRLTHGSPDLHALALHIEAEVRYLRRELRRAEKAGAIDATDSGELRLEVALVQLRASAFALLADAARWARGWRERDNGQPVTAEELGDPEDHDADSWDEHVRGLVARVVWVRDFLEVAPGPLA